MSDFEMYSSRNNNSNHSERPLGKYEQKLNYVKTLIREYVHENAALVDEIDEMQVKILIKKEERKFLLKKLCEFEPSTANEVQSLAKKTGSSVPDAPSPVVESKKVKRKHSGSTEPSKSRGESKSRSDRKSHSRRPSKSKKRVIPPISLDSTGKPIFPIDLGRLTVHSLGEVIPDKAQFHTEEVIFPVGYVSTRIYGSLKDPTVKCIYTCKISDANDLPRFRDTLSLIKYISGRYKQQHLYSQMFTTLAVLNYRCQARLYYKLLEMKRRENREYQKIIADFCNKSNAAAAAEPNAATQGGTTQPNAASPVSPSGSVGSIGSHSSSGYSSSELPSTRNQGMWIPMPVYNAVSVQNQHFTYLLTYMDLWETADNLVQNANLTEFFIQLDRTCRPLTLHSTIRHLVSYVKKGIMLVQREMQEGSS